MNPQDIHYPLLKGTTALGAFVAMDWLTEVGRVCAALTAIVIFGEVLWKKVLKPLINWYRSRE